MENITDNLISLEEARFALNCMEKHGFSAQESLESVDSFVSRVRTVGISRLTDYIIETRLTDIQRQTLEDYWFKNISPVETAKRLNMSLRAVYSSRNKAQAIIKEYIEPVLIYFKDMPEYKLTPLVVDEVLSSKRKPPYSKGIGGFLKAIRVQNGADKIQASKALGISVKRLTQIEQSDCEPTVAEIKKYSNVFGIKIIMNFENGSEETQWIKQ